MTVHQLSVYIENKSGALVSVLRLLKQEKIQLIASTIADTVDYGIFRIICSQPEKAYKVLKDAGVAVSLCEVFAVELDDRPGMAADAIELFASEGISLAYLYSFKGRRGHHLSRPSHHQRKGSLPPAVGADYCRG